MSDTQAAETPLADHVERLWKHLETETVRIVLDLQRTVGVDAPDGPIVYWDGATFSDDVAKAIVAERSAYKVQFARLALELAGFKRTALAMRDEAIFWNRDGKDRSDEIQRLYFNAAMGIVFAPGDAFTHDQSPADTARNRSSMEQGGISDRLSNFDEWGDRIKDRS